MQEKDPSLCYNSLMQTAEAGRSPARSQFLMIKSGFNIENKKVRFYGKTDLDSNGETGAFTQIEDEILENGCQ